jgi:hypothetical protein
VINTVGFLLSAIPNAVEVTPSMPLAPRLKKILNLFAVLLTKLSRSLTGRLFPIKILLPEGTDLKISLMTEGSFGNFAFSIIPALTFSLISSA